MKSSSSSRKPTSCGASRPAKRRALNPVSGAESQVESSQLELPRFVWVVSGFTCCGPGGEAYAAPGNPQGSLTISGVFMDEESARAAFYQAVTKQSNIEYLATSKRACAKNNGCDECYEFCKAEQEKFFQKYKARRVEDAQKEYDDAVREQKKKKTEEGKQKVLDYAVELEEAKNDKTDFKDKEAVIEDFFHDWLGPGTEELEGQVVEGKLGAWRYFHFHKSPATGRRAQEGISDDGEGGLRFYEEVCECDIIEETLMKRMPLT
jgi:hypothetical protein